MGKILARLLAVLLFFGLIVVGIGYSLPRDFEFETSRQIKATPEQVFAMINELPNWKQWSTWNEEKIEGLKIKYGEKKAGVGAVQTWTDARGSGKLWITASVHNKHLEYKLKFGDFPEMNSRFELNPSDSGTLIRWKSSGRLPDGPFYGYSAILFPTQMKNQYEHSLNRLNEILER